jgi:hypothetical protein
VIRRRRRLGFAALALVALFAAVWAALLGSDQCGNADTVACTPLGWVLLYGWMALGVLAAAMVLLVIGLSLVATVQRRSQKP